MESNQMKAIQKSLSIAKQIQKTNPEIKEKYISGETFNQIAEYLRENNYDNPFLIGSIHYAIAGHEGGFNIKPFSGLITDKDQLEQIARNHNFESGKKLYKERKGVHGVPMEIRRQYLQKAKQELIRKLRNGEVKIGFSTLPLEKKLEISKQAVQGRGQIPWDDLYSKELGLSAEDYALQLSQSEDYKYKTGGNKGKVMWKAIAEELSNHFSTEFSRHAVYCRLIGNKRQKQKKQRQN